MRSIFMAIILTITTTFASASIFESSHPMVQENKINTPVIINVIGKINESSASRFVDELARAQETGQSVVLINISSYGGSVYALLRMVDAIRNSKVPVATVIKGKAMSAAAILASCGAPGRRYASANSTIMIHEVGSMVAGKVGDLKASTAEGDRLNTLIMKIMAENIGKDISYVTSLIHQKGHADWYLTAQEALRLGFVDKIGIPEYKIKIDIKFTLD